MRRYSRHLDNRPTLFSGTSIASAIVSRRKENVDADRLARVAIARNGAIMKTSTASHNPETSIVTKLHRLPMLIALAVSITAAACATAANKTDEVGSDTGSAVGSVGDAVVSVVEWPFHVIADIL
jgi:hypothetical protein